METLKQQLVDSCKRIEKMLCEIEQTSHCIVAASNTLNNTSK
jgi:hypothetical protein